MPIDASLLYIGCDITSSYKTLTLDAPPLFSSTRISAEPGARDRFLKDLKKKTKGRICLCIPASSENAYGILNCCCHYSIPILLMTDEELAAAGAPPTARAIREWAGREKLSPTPPAEAKLILEVMDEKMRALVINQLVVGDALDPDFDLSNTRLAALGSENNLRVAQIDLAIQEILKDIRS